LLYWNLNSGPCTCRYSTISTMPSAFFALVDFFLHKSLAFLPVSALDCSPPTYTSCIANECATMPGLFVEMDSC
jgi:hypothetical protein